MSYMEKYESWLADPVIDEATKDELRAIKGNDAEIEDRFFKDLEFGTGGMRGVLGAGTNRLNIYTIRKATQGLANYLLKEHGEPGNISIAIAHDCRNMSPEFCTEAALVFCANGIKAWVFDSLRPTPALSFAVRHLKCQAGIVITASHNPPEYNGYKAYLKDGGQAPYPHDEAIINEVNLIEGFSQVKTIKKNEAESSGLYNVIDPETDNEYIKNVLNCRIKPEIGAKTDLTIVYTPLHGTGNMPVKRALFDAGYKNLFIVPEQEKPDGNFPTVSYPNPEDAKAFALALKLAENKNADIVIATDPDADRIGIAVKGKKGGYELLNGNMTGVLITNYLLSQKKEAGTLPHDGVVISTIVSTALTKRIVESYGLKYIDVLTGFKYIGEKMTEFDEKGEGTYVFGFEESYGSLAGTYARDKDAIVASLLACEIAAYYKEKGMTLLDALYEIYEKYGYYEETIVSITLPGVEGLADMKRLMTALREKPHKTLGGVPVTQISDYLNGTTVLLPWGGAKPTNLPISDVLHYKMEDLSWICVRPSGTEPKVKIYFGVCMEGMAIDDAKRAAEKKLNENIKEMKAIIDKILNQ